MQETIGTLKSQHGTVTMRVRHEWDGLAPMVQLDYDTGFGIQRVEVPASQAAEFAAMATQAAARFSAGEVRA